MMIRMYALNFPDSISMTASKIGSEANNMYILILLSDVFFSQCDSGSADSGKCK